MIYTLVCPWKIHNKSIFYSALSFFKERIHQHTKLEIRSPKSDFSSATEQNQFLIKEMQRAKESGFAILCCDENGSQMSSEAFAHLIQTKERQFPKGILLCLGGAYGLPEEAREYIEFPLLSFSSMTFSHELASTIALEQMYRQLMIRKSHPYHHGDASKLAEALKRKN